MLTLLAPSCTWQTPIESSRVQLNTKFGIALVASGMGILAAWNFWTRTRNLVPVNQPVSLVAGETVVSSFTLNFDGLYLIQIGAEKDIPPDTLHCLLGVDRDPTGCAAVQPVVGASWVLFCAGQEIRRGSSQEGHSAPADSETISREIGEFHGQSGQDYTLHVTFTRDGAPLAPANPRLKVAVSGIAREDLQAAGVLAFSVSFICTLFGSILLVVASYARARSTTPKP